MKKILTSVLLSTCMIIYGCGDGQEGPAEAAKEANEEKRSDDTTQSTIAVVKDDSEFLVEAASGGLMEVELGRLAQEKATDPKVKQFGSMMVTDHSKANDELKALAARKNVTLPSTPGTDHQEHINELTKKTGREFDRAYMSMMVDDHREDVEKFEKAANNAQDADIKTFAGKTLPVLKSHLEQARSINDGIRK